MALSNILSIASSGMSAQSVRLNIAASNLANANTIASSEDTAFRALEPVFTPIRQDRMQSFSESLDTAIAQGVRVSKMQKSQQEVEKEYQPANPLADKNGYIYKSNVNSISEMTNVIEASRDYERNIQVMQTAKKLIEHTLKLAE